MALLLLVLVLLVWTPVTFRHYKRSLDGTYVRWSVEAEQKRANK